MRKFLLVALLSGCAAQALHIPGVVETAKLPPWNGTVNAKSEEIVCPKCAQPHIRPTYALDSQGHELLVWTCKNCLAQWYSRVATPKP